MTVMGDTAVFQPDTLKLKTGMIKWTELPYDQVEQAYIRCEVTHTRTCCAPVDFETFFLMVLPKGQRKALKVEVMDESFAKKYLSDIEEKIPGVKIGFDKSA